MNSLRKINYRPGVKIAVVNRKGGVGKSMIVTNLAGELAIRGYNIGVVDTDSQGNAALYFGMQAEDGLFKSIVGTQQGEVYTPSSLDSVVRVVPGDSYLVAGDYQPGHIFLLPSSANTYRIPFMSDDPGVFGDVLNDFVERYELDFVFIDTAPTMSMFDGSVYMATDAFIHVTELEIGSIEGLRNSIEQIARFNKRRVREGKEPNRVLGIVLNKMRNLREHVENAVMVKQAFPTLVAPPVRQLKNYAAATKYGQTVRAYKPNGSEAPEILAMVDYIEGAIVQWITETA